MGSPYQQQEEKMARPHRFLLSGQPQHVIQRGNDRAPVFFGDGDCRFYLECLGQACVRYGCDVHAYVLMTNHVHLLLSPATPGALPRMMQSLARRYVQFVNWRRERSGHLWQGRYRAAAVDTDAYFLTCSRYIELNPVRAGMVDDPAAYEWSSFRANALGRPDPLVKRHPLYLSLGRTDAECREAYRLLFDQELDDDALTLIRASTEQGWPLGDRYFRDAIGQASRRRARPLPKGGQRVGQKKIN